MKTYHATLTSYRVDKKGPHHIGILATDNYAEIIQAAKKYANWHCEGSVTIWQLIEPESRNPWRPVVTIKADAPHMLERGATCDTE